MADDLVERYAELIRDISQTTALDHAYAGRVVDFVARRIHAELEAQLAEARAEVERLHMENARLRSDAAQTDVATEANATIVRAMDALGPQHPVWSILDDYDGSMDNVKALVNERDQARTEVERLTAQNAALRAVEVCGCGDPEDHARMSKYITDGEEPSDV